MTKVPIRAAAFCWYRREDYARIRTLMRDGYALPASFAAWQERNERGVARFESEGGIAMRVYLDPEEFAAWCAKRRLAPDASARLQYVAEAAADRRHEPARKAPPDRARARAAAM